MTTQLAVSPTSNMRTSLAKTDPMQFANFFQVAACRIVGASAPDDGKAVALTCWQENLTLLEFSRRYHLINGRPAMRSDAMLAEFRATHGGNYVIRERSSTRAAIDFTDRFGNKYSVELTWEDVEQSRWPWRDWKNKDKGLKDAWATPLDRKAMLFARLVSESLRAIAPELVAGVYEVSELQDAVDTPSSSGTIDAVSFRETPAPLPPGMKVLEDGEIVEADFETVSETPETEAADQADETYPEPPAEQQSNDESFAFATARQVKRIEELRDALNIEPEIYAAILAKRGVERVDKLSQEQAAEIIDRMELHLAEAQK